MLFLFALFWLPSSKFWFQALLAEYCVVSCYLRRFDEGPHRSSKKLRWTCAAVAAGILIAHVGALLGQRHDQIENRTGITAVTVIHRATMPISFASRRPADLRMP